MTNPLPPQIQGVLGAYINIRTIERVGQNG